MQQASVGDRKFAGVFIAFGVEQSGESTGRELANMDSDLGGALGFDRLNLGCNFGPGRGFLKEITENSSKRRSESPPIRKTGGNERYPSASSG